jgi:hypothetical protein
MKLVPVIYPPWLVRGRKLYRLYWWDRSGLFQLDEKPGYPFLWGQPLR